jgi:hypothetical protein
MGPPSMPRGSFHAHGFAVTDSDREIDTDADNSDTVVSVVVVLCVLLITASLAVTRLLRIRLLERVSYGEKVNPPSLLTRLLCGPCSLYYWEGSSSIGRYAASWCCWRPSPYMVHDVPVPPPPRVPKVSSGVKKTPVEAFTASPDKPTCRTKSRVGAVSPDRPTSSSSKGSSCSTRASTPGSKGQSPGPEAVSIGKESNPGTPTSNSPCRFSPSHRGQVRGEAPPLPPLTKLPMPPRK